MSSCAYCRPVNLAKAVKNNFVSSRRTRVDMGRVPFYRDGGGERFMGSMARGVRASMVDSSESSSDFVKRTEQAWLISQQPRPVSCSTCNSNGHVECKWCGGTGFFMIGDNMLCHVHSRNSDCVICAGKGSMCCSDCKGTGFRAKWLGEPPIHK
ncbi:uncharacterized protein LOC122090736 [Macadamia integrifolia]|uniref:uncharacterized protein LOC122090736 n=1 Tax=Macadamia integrifolia TaxID=60698 RepID=UPI001C4F19B6|nr:uncharacterized protein LOC122090736 [Macadamia integrifolia]